jgi:hypothetical protein
VDFFDRAGLVDTVTDLLENPAERQRLQRKRGQIYFSFKGRSKVWYGSVRSCQEKPESN